ncbi:MAG: hypothetical protein ABIR15_11985 [Chitinophagaceae bacterium]
MKKIIPGFAILILINSICFCQLVKSNPFRLPPVKDDTLYLDVQNVVALKNNVSEIVNIKAENANLTIKKDSLIVIPTQLGLLTITFVYKEKTEKKTYFCKQLPYPGR